MKQNVLKKLFAKIPACYITWLLVVIALMLKCYTFEALIYAPNPTHWKIMDYLSKGATSMLLALPVLWSRRKYMGWIILGLTDLWLIVNLLYYRVYHLFVTWHLLRIVTNLHGFEDSVLPYLDISIILLLASSLLLLPSMFYQAKRAPWYGSCIIVLVAIMTSVGGSYAHWRDYRNGTDKDKFNWTWINPGDLPQSQSANLWASEKQGNCYVRTRSILEYPIFLTCDAIRTLSNKDEVPELTEEENAELQQLLNPVEPANAPEGNLLIILLESFESWILDAEYADGKPVCPYLRQYISTHPVLYAKDVTSQTMYGLSGDGQLIVNTGLLPLVEGVACVSYAYNTYPNLAHFYPYSAVVNPCRNVWNQTAITPSYGYKQLIEPETDEMRGWNDSVLIDNVIETFYALDTPCCIMGITVSGHSPFTFSPDPLVIDDNIPTIIRDYMRTAHFTDRQLGRLLAWADTAAMMANSTIAITGDHRIFGSWGAEDVRDYGLRANLPFGTGCAGCPFILASPRITNTQVVEHGLQVDIFPTILDAIGQKNYFWKGTGRDLLDNEPSCADRIRIRHHLSDKLIRMNYFATE